LRKRLIVKPKAKANKKTGVNDNGQINARIPQRTNSTPNGPEATTKPTNRRR
jgi:hypothetical protein